MERLRTSMDSGYEKISISIFGVSAEDVAKVRTPEYNQEVGYWYIDFKNVRIALFKEHKDVAEQGTG